MLRRPHTSLAAAPRPALRNSVPRSRGLGWRTRLAWIAAIALLLLALCYLLWPVLSMLLAAATFAYLLDPVVDRFEVRGRSREFGIAVIFLLTLAVLLLLGLVVVPLVARQLSELSSNLNSYILDLATHLEPFRLWFEERLQVTIPLNVVELGQEIPNYIKQLSPKAQETIQGFVRQALSSSIGLVLTVINLLLLPIFTFYLLRDWDRMMARLSQLLPPRYSQRTMTVLAEIDRRMSSFVRGQITVCLLLGLLYSLGLWLFSGIDLPFVVGMLSGMLFIVPYLGTVLGVVLASVLALLKFGPDFHMLVVWGVFGVVQLIEGTLLTPLIVGDKVGLHPLVVMVALIVGGNLLGIWGMLLAIPITAALSVLLGTLLESYEKSNFYNFKN